VGYAENFFYTYSTLAKLTGQTPNTVYQHRTRGQFDPADLRTVLLYLAEYAVPDLQDDIVERGLRGVREKRKSPTSRAKPTKKRVARRS
jgi:hypothetical protein